MFINKKTGLTVPVYVDDLLIIGPRGSKQIAYLKKTLDNRFKMTDLGPCHHYLGMEVIRDRDNRTLSISQSSYVQKVLYRFGMQDCKPAPTPMDTGIKLEPSKDATVAKVKLYQAMVGSLMYLAYQTRPDICFGVVCLSRQNMSPSKEAFGAVKKLLRYLKGSANMKITYGIGTGFEGFTDADWAGEITSRHSTGAYLFLLYGGAISWSSKLQTCVALSSCEAEYMAQTQASKEAIWISRLLKELDMGFDLPGTPVTIKADNQGAIALAKDPKFKPRHFLKVFWLQTCTFLP